MDKSKVLVIGMTLIALVNIAAFISNPLAGLLTACGSYALADKILDKINGEK